MTKNNELNWINDYKTAFGKEGLIVLAWWTGTLFASEIRKKYGSWPILELTGDSGAGRTSMIRFLWRLLGHDHMEGYRLDRMTSVHKHRLYCQRNDLPIVWVDGDGVPEEKQQEQFLIELNDFYYGTHTRRLAHDKSETHTTSGGIMLALKSPIPYGITGVSENIVQVPLFRDNLTLATQTGLSALNQLFIEDLTAYFAFGKNHQAEIFDIFHKEFCRLLNAWQMPYITPGAISYNHIMIAGWSKVLSFVFGQELSGEYYLFALCCHRIKENQKEVER